MNANDTSEQVLALVPPELHKYLTVHPKNVSGKSPTNYVRKLARAVNKLSLHRCYPKWQIYPYSSFVSIVTSTRE